MPERNKEADRRRVELGKIHVGKKRLALDDVVYRAIIKRLCNGKTSAGDLDQAERGALLDELKRLGFIEAGSYTRKLSDFDDREPQAKLIRCLWADCFAFGLIADASEKALARFIRRTAKVDSIRWLTASQANQVIEGLKAMKARSGHKQKSTGSR